MERGLSVSQPAPPFVRKEFPVKMSRSEMDPTAKRETEGNTFTALPRNRMPAITSIDIQFSGLSIRSA